MTSVQRNLSIHDIVAIAIVLLISLAIGIYFRFSGGRQRTTKEFLVAGRAMSPFPVVFSLIVTFVSATSMLGIPAEVYDYGLYRLVAYTCSTISNVISAYVFLPVYFEMTDSVSVYEYIERRFGILTRKVSSALFIVQSAFLMAVVLYAPALALSAVCNLNIYASVVTIGGICTLYCTMGGMKAVLWTDVFQAIIMYICSFAIFIRGIMVAELSFTDAFRLLHENKNTFFSFDPSVRYTLWNCVLYGLILGMFNYGCNQAQIQRMLSVKSLKLSQRAVIVSVPLAIILLAMNFLLGVIMYSNYYPETKWTSLNLQKKDQMVPYFVMNNFLDYPGLPGVCIAGIFCGSLSTISSCVNSLAAVTMEDFVLPYFSTRRKLTERTLACLVKVFALGYGLIGIGCAFILSAHSKGLVHATTVVLGTVSGPIVGLFSLAMLTTTANGKGALRGLVIGILFSSALGIISTIKIKCKRFCEISQPQITTELVNATATLNGYSATDSNSSVLETWTSTAESRTPFINYSTTAVINCATETFNTTTESTKTYSKQCCEIDEWMSVMWLMIIGFIVTVVVGYFYSLLSITFRKPGHEKYDEVDPVLLSPLVRKWLVKPLPQSSPEEGEELEKLNGSIEP